MNKQDPKPNTNLEELDIVSIQNQYVDLLSEKVGGRAIACSDDWFASCDNLVKPGRGTFTAGKFISTGQLMDGWESRRSFGRSSDRGLDSRSRSESAAEQGDWCVLRMGLSGVVRFFDIDTNHFRGNAPERVMVQAASLKGEPDLDTPWTTILDSSEVQANSQNLFACNSASSWTHLRLSMFPDGGIARFRAYGEVRPNRHHYIDGELVDLASVTTGARGFAASDMFYSSPQNLTLPGRGVDMGDGWETKRRRDNNNDWAILKLGTKGAILKVIIDTAHFKGNFPDSASLLAIDAELLNLSDKDLLHSSTQWQTVLKKMPLYADKEHLFIDEIQVGRETEFTHVKLNIFPDGGVSRLRVLGRANWDSILKSNEAK
ncbi:MAG: allantoicase [Arenicella sp.]|jgi:allantoicase